MPTQTLSIGRLATAAGVNLETVRYYERIGLMPKPDRTAAGHRSYGPDHVGRLKFIRRARELGFTLDDIRALVSLNDPEGSCGVAEEIATAHLRKVRAKLADLRRLERVLSETVGQCRDGRPHACPVLEALSGCA